MLGVLVVYANRQLGLSRTSALIGVLYAAGAVGSLLASASLSGLTRRVTIPSITLVSLTAGRTLVTALALTDQVAVALPSTWGFYAANQLTIMNGIAYRLVVTPDRLQGRANVAARLLAWGGQPIGAIIGGILATVFTVRLALLAAGGGLAVSLIYGLLGPLRACRFETTRVTEVTPDQSPA